MALIAEAMLGSMNMLNSYRQLFLLLFLITSCGGGGGGGSAPAAARGRGQQRQLGGLTPVDAERLERVQRRQLTEDPRYQARPLSADSDEFPRPPFRAGAGQDERVRHYAGRRGGTRGLPANLSQVLFERLHPSEPDQLDRDRGLPRDADGARGSGRHLVW